MLASARRLPRVASALAQRRHYLGVVLRGGDGTKPIAFKLSLPWGKTPLLKPFDDVANPILRVLSPSISSSIKDDSRVIITLTEESTVIASVELLPKAIELECDDDEDEEESTSDGDEDESDDLYPTMEDSSGDSDMLLMDLFYQGGEAERALKEAEKTETLPERKCSDTEGPYNSFVMEFSFWPHDFFAHATILRTDGRDCIWQSSWSFNMDGDSLNEEMSDTHRVQGPIVALSNYHDQRLEYTGVICGSMLEKFKISFNTHYEVKELLGSGAEGQVYRCVSLDNSHSCAVKWSFCKHIIIDEPREPLTMKKIFHPNVKRIFCAWKENSGETDLAKDSIFLAHELCKCTLEEYLDEKPLKSISDRIKIFAEAVSGVSYLHGQGIVHRDIKCSNIFLDDHGCAKIGDFGQSGLISSHSCCHGGKLYGTKLYGSPELLRKQRHGVKSDIFSLGMVYAELCGPSAVAVERHEWLLKLRKLIQSRQWKTNPLSTWKKSELSKDWTGDAYLMMEMLEWSPEERPSCMDILAKLNFVVVEN